MRRVRSRALGVGALCFAMSAPAVQETRVRTVHVAKNVYMLVGRGGNIGLSVGEDGAFLIDDQFAPMVGRIREAVGKLSKSPVRFLVNTHWHGDHTGGNERFGEAGAVIVAHENVRKRLSTDQFMEAFGRKVKASPKKALPIVTFADAVTLYWNDDEIRVFHVAHAHTDGDSVIWFKKADVIHAGDTYFNGMYPFIDVGSGGGIEGMVAAAGRLLEIAGAKTKIIPGHGPLSNRDELAAYRDMLVAVAARVRKLIAEGKSADEVVAARPTAAFDAKWGKGFMKPEPWTRIVYDSLKRR